MRLIDADALTDFLKCLLPEREMWEIDGDVGENAVCETVAEAIEMVKNMETINPETNCSEIPNNSDTISRQAAIENSFEVYTKEYGWCEVVGVDAISELPSAQPEQRWIPCSERLPERGKDVLVTRDYDGREDNIRSCRYVEVANCYGEDDDITWSSFSDEYKMKPRNHHVVAWMPLPEPYREDKPWSTC